MRRDYCRFRFPDLSAEYIEDLRLDIHEATEDCPFRGPIRHGMDALFDTLESQQRRYSRKVECVHCNALTVDDFVVWEDVLLQAWAGDVEGARETWEAAQ